MDTNTISLIIAIIGCLVGIAGWVTRRDSKTETDAEWRGSVNAKLNMILGIRDEFESFKENIQQAVTNHEARIKSNEARIKSIENEMK